MYTIYGSYEKPRIIEHMENKSPNTPISLSSINEVAGKFIKGEYPPVSKIPTYNSKGGQGEIQHIGDWLDFRNKSGNVNIDAENGFVKLTGNDVKVSNGNLKFRDDAAGIEKTLANKNLLEKDTWLNIWSNGNINLKPVENGAIQLSGKEIVIPDANIVATFNKKPLILMAMASSAGFGNGAPAVFNDIDPIEYPIASLNAFGSGSNLGQDKKDRNSSFYVQLFVENGKWHAKFKNHFKEGGHDAGHVRAVFYHKSICQNNVANVQFSHF